MKFQNPRIHRSKVKTHTHTHRQTDKPKAICPSNFFKVGGIKIRFFLIEAHIAKKKIAATVCMSKKIKKKERKQEVVLSDSENDSDDDVGNVRWRVGNTVR